MFYFWGWCILLILLWKGCCLRVRVCWNWRWCSGVGIVVEIFRWGGNGWCWIVWIMWYRRLVLRYISRVRLLVVGFVFVMFFFRVLSLYVDRRWCFGGYYNRIFFEDRREMISYCLMDVRGWFLVVKLWLVLRCLWVDIGFFYLVLIVGCWVLFLIIYVEECLVESVVIYIVVSIWNYEVMFID